MIHCWCYDSVWPYDGIYISQTFVWYISKAAKYGGTGGSVRLIMIQVQEYYKVE